jgi:hypothetical protein
MLCVFSIATGCRKETIAFIENNDPANLYKTSSPGGCRVTSYDYYNGKDDYHAVDLYRFENGKVAEVQTYLRFTMEYDKPGKLIRSKVYDGDRPAYIITFGYRDHKVVTETWRYAWNNEIYDQVNLSYNKKGDLIRNESIAQHYYTLYTWYPDGSLQSWVFYYGGTPLQKGEYKYENNFKNPLSTLTGLDHMFMFANSGFGVGMGKNWFSGEKISYWDGTSWFVYYELGPANAKWDAGAQHYPSQSYYVDKNSGNAFNATFIYENCKGQTEKNSSAGYAAHYQSPATSNTINQKQSAKRLIY